MIEKFRRRAGLFAACLVLFAAIGMLGCAENAATGRSQFTAFVPPEEEAAIGRDQHPQVLAEFGGAYANPKLAAYVQKLGEALVARSENAGQPFVFTVIDSDIYNAFALPGGYVYVTRGLLALMSNEAEFASVIGHEIGHVTARHTAERASSGQAASIFTGILGLGVAVLTGSQDAGNLASQVGEGGASVWLAGFSREQEFEADKLGVRYMAAEGYDPREAADMLFKLGEASRLETKMLGRSAETADQFSILQSHPRTADRVVAATDAARDQGMKPVANPRLGEREYLDAIDGMAYGGDAKSGNARAKTSVRPNLRIRIVTTRSGDTQESMARRMATQDGFDLERFQIYNGLKPGEALAPGRRLKIVADK